MSDTTEPTPPSEAGDRRPIDARAMPFIQNLAKTLTAKGVKPNKISLLSLAFAAAGYVFLLGAGRLWSFPWLWFILAAVCIVGRLLCNVLDGLVAVEGGQKEKGGVLFNEVPDRVADALFFIGATYATGSVAGAWCAALAITTAYSRALGASMGHGQDFGGPCAKQQRMFFLIVALVVAAVVSLLFTSKLDIFHLRAREVLSYCLWAIAAGTAYTAWLRLQRLYQKLP